MVFCLLQPFQQKQKKHDLPCSIIPYFFVTILDLLKLNPVCWPEDQDVGYSKCDLNSSRADRIAIKILSFLYNSPKRIGS